MALLKQNQIGDFTRQLGGELILFNFSRISEYDGDIWNVLKDESELITFW